MNYTCRYVDATIPADHRAMKGFYPQKKDVAWRCCADFRKFKANSMAQRDAYPLLCIDELAGSQFFTTLYLALGYWHADI